MAECATRTLTQTLNFLPCPKSISTNVKEFGEDIEADLISMLVECESFVIYIDESTNKGDIPQGLALIYVCMWVCVCV